MMVSVWLVSLETEQADERDFLKLTLTFFPSLLSALQAPQAGCKH